GAVAHRVLPSFPTRRSSDLRWFQDDFYLCLHREPLGRVWGYDPAARRVVDITARIPALRDQFCSSIRWDAPLSASFQDSGGALRDRKSTRLNSSHDQISYAV